MVSLQIPASLLSEWLGAAVALALGIALARLGDWLAGLSGDHRSSARSPARVGVSTQHPIASALIALRFCRAALAQGARHGQSRRRSRQDDDS
jgi:hypothetical protein